MFCLRFGRNDWPLTNFSRLLKSPQMTFAHASFAEGFCARPSDCPGRPPIRLWVWFGKGDAASIVVISCHENWTHFHWLRKVNYSQRKNIRRGKSVCRGAVLKGRRGGGGWGWILTDEGSSLQTLQRSFWGGWWRWTDRQGWLAQMSLKVTMLSHYWAGGTCAPYLSSTPGTLQTKPVSPPKSEVSTKFKLFPP